MSSIIINTFYINDKILSNKYIHGNKQELQLTTNRYGSSCNTIPKKS